MQRLSTTLNPSTIGALRIAIDRGTFPQVSFEQAMKFLLTDGIFPASGLPVTSFFMLESWARAQASPHTTPVHASASITQYTATELKNKTGQIIDNVLRGHIVHITKHGRVIAEINPVATTGSESN